ncbi:hypothetical protein LEMLEM_LOCUS27275 [Lemmus lemmus]
MSCERLGPSKIGCTSSKSPASQLTKTWLTPDLRRALESGGLRSQEELLVLLKDKRQDVNVLASRALRSLSASCQGLGAAAVCGKGLCWASFEPSVSSQKSLSS